MSTWAVVPVKGFGRSKTRLSEDVGARSRAELAQAMAADSLAAVARSRYLAGFVCVSDEPAVRVLAAELGAELVADPAEPGHSEAALAGIGSLGRARADRVALLPGDCPLLDPGELDRMLEATAGTEVVIVPDREGSGTNGLVLSPPAVIRPGFGPGSCERHRDRAERAGAGCRIERVPSLLFDVDTPADLGDLRRALAADPGRAPRTAEALGRIAAAGAGS